MSETLKNLNENSESTQTHCILLIQVGPIESRIYSDFESVTDCCKGILQIYEDYLARLHNTEAKINYGAANALRFVNDVTDISCLVYHEASGMYAPYPREWILEKLLMLFKPAQNALTNDHE
ncbi:enhancer of rudimentary homolog [Homalodisca vitripennis]|uniref:enhancer of rudimentary homolog n=1 Tax=Homalodisca vitripennis TaxID=197043 RepID=UPI001EEB112B|nr:enhancer of rudimentary homolog [Homalodisca vitripennis]